MIIYIRNLLVVLVLNYIFFLLFLRTIGPGEEGVLSLILWTVYFISGIIFTWIEFKKFSCDKNLFQHIYLGLIVFSLGAFIFSLISPLFAIFFDSPNYTPSMREQIYSMKDHVFLMSNFFVPLGAFIGLLVGYFYYTYENNKK